MWGSRVSQVPGTNGKMSEVTAAVGLASLDAWPENRQRWLYLAEEASRISKELGFPPEEGAPRGLATPYWNIKLKEEKTRTGLAAFLTENGVETRRWWGDGCHTMPAYQEIPHGALPQTEQHARTILGLPFHLSLRSPDLTRIGSLIGRYLDDQSA